MLGTRISDPLNSTNTLFFSSGRQQAMNIELSQHISREATGFVAELEDAKAECDDSVLSIRFGILEREAEKYLLP